MGHWQAGGWLKLLWIAGGERCDTLPTGRDGPKAGPGPPSTYTKRTQPFVRRSGLPSHTQRERETRRTRHAESAPAHSRVLTLTVSQAGEHRRLPGRQAGRQAEAGRGRQAGGQARQPRHVTTPTALPSLGSIRSRSGGRVSPTFPSSSTATLCPRCPRLTRSSLLVRSLVLSGAPFRAATLPLPLRCHLIPDLLVVVLLPLPHASADALFRKRARSCLSFSPRFFSFSRILAFRPCLLSDPSV